MTTAAAAGTFPADLFAGRQVLVVGGSSGIGAGIAAAFLRAGAQVQVTGATPADAALAAGDADLRGATPVQLDVRDDAAVRACVDALPRLDVLVNCAGILRRGEELAPAVFAQVVDINLTGSMRACAAGCRRS